MDVRIPLLSPLVLLSCVAGPAPTPSLHALEIGEVTKRTGTSLLLAFQWAEDEKIQMGLTQLPNANTGLPDACVLSLDLAEVEASLARSWTDAEITKPKFSVKFLKGTVQFGEVLETPMGAVDVQGTQELPDMLFEGTITYQYKMGGEVTDAAHQFSTTPCIWAE